MGLPVVQFSQRNLEWQELTKPKLDQNWKTSKPGTLTSGLQTARNLMKPIDLNYLEA